MYAGPRRLLLIGTLTAILGGALWANGIASPPREPVLGSCEGCEAVFDGLPPVLASTARIAPKDEPGEPMRIEGTVYGGDGIPVPGIVVYAYHTDAAGVYPPDGRLRSPFPARHGRLRGWAKSDAGGRYRFDTIRPASYPDTNIPAHVHMHVIEPGCCTYYIDSIHFEDDPRLSREERYQLRAGRGGSGLTQPVKGEDGVWMVKRDIHLGQGITGYPRAGPGPRIAGTMPCRLDAGSGAVAAARCR